MGIRGLKHALVIIVTGFLVLIFTGYVYTNHVQRESNSKWCDLLNTLDEPPPANASERTRKVQTEIHKLRREFRCQNLSTSVTKQKTPVVRMMPHAVNSLTP